MFVSRGCKSGGGSINISNDIGISVNACKTGGVFIGLINLGSVQILFKSKLSYTFCV